MINTLRIDESIILSLLLHLQGYYHTLYSKFFNHKTIGKGLRSKEYRGMDFESYCSESLTSPILIPCWMPFKTQRYHRVIDMKNISRLKSTEDSINAKVCL